MSFSKFMKLCNNQQNLVLGHLFHPFIPCSSCYNKIPETASLIENRNLFLTVPEAGTCEIKVPDWSNYGEDPLPGSETSGCFFT